MPVRVIVVSDGSTDRTDAIALDHGAVLVRLPNHRGKGAALRAGFAQAMELDPSYLVTMDADGQHDPADLERLVWPVMVGDCALATGSRFLSDSSWGPTPLNRYLVRKVLIAVLRVTLGGTYTDPCCGYRCFSPQALKAIRLERDHYQSELEALFEAAIHGLRVVEVPVRKKYPPGWSKMGAPSGRLAGRAWVIAQYVSTIGRKTRGLRRARAMARPSVRASVPFPHSGRTPDPVHIGSNTLIGYKVAVMAGVNIGNRCVVAANSVVTKDVPDQTIVGGVPARVIKKIVPRPEDPGPGGSS